MVMLLAAAGGDGGGGALKFAAIGGDDGDTGDDAVEFAAAGEVDTRSAILASQPWQQRNNNSVDIMTIMRMFVCLFDYLFSLFDCLFVCLLYLQ